MVGVVGLGTAEVGVPGKEVARVGRPGRPLGRRDGGRGAWRNCGGAAFPAPAASAVTPQPAPCRGALPGYVVAISRYGLPPNWQRDRPGVGRVEVGNRPPKEDYLAAIDKRLNTGGLFLRMLKKVIESDSQPPWLRKVINVGRSCFSTTASKVRW